MIQHEDGTITLEDGDGIDLREEIAWVTNEFLRDHPCAGVIVFEGVGRFAGYALFPYFDSHPPAAG